MKKVFIEAYLDNNIGDDLMVRILVEKNQDVQFYITTTNSVVINTFSCIPNLKILRRSEYLLILDEIDAYVRIGGSIFQHHTQFDNISKLRRYRALRKIKKKGVILLNLGSNLGPYNARFSKMISRIELKLFDAVTVRDKKSLSIANNEFKLDNTSLFDDIIFEMDSSKYLIHNTEYKNEKPMELKSLGITAYRSVRNVERNYFFYQELTSFVSEFCNENNISKVFLFAFDTENENDLSAAHHIKEMLEATNSSVNIEIVPYLGKNLVEFLQTFSMMSFMVAIRFHGAILSDLFSIPFLPIAYSNKMENYISDSHENHTVIKFESPDFNNVNLEDLKNRVKPVERGHFALFRNLLKKY